MRITNEIREYVKGWDITLNEADLGKLEEKVYQTLCEVGLQDIINNKVIEWAESSGLRLSDTTPKPGDRIVLVTGRRAGTQGTIVGRERGFKTVDEKGEFVPYSGIILESEFPQLSHPYKFDGNVLTIRSGLEGEAEKHPIGQVYKVLLDGETDVDILERSDFNLLADNVFLLETEEDRAFVSDEFAKMKSKEDIVVLRKKEHPLFLEYYQSSFWLIRPVFENGSFDHYDAKQIATEGAYEFVELYLRNKIVNRESIVSRRIAS